MQFRVPPLKANGNLPANGNCFFSDPDLNWGHAGGRLGALRPLTQVSGRDPRSALVRRHCARRPGLTATKLCRPGAKPAGATHWHLVPSRVKRGEGREQTGHSCQYRNRHPRRRLLSDSESEIRLSREFLNAVKKWPEQVRIMRPQTDPYHLLVAVTPLDSVLYKDIVSALPPGELGGKA